MNHAREFREVVQSIRDMHDCPVRDHAFADPIAEASTEASRSFIRRAIRRVAEKRAAATVGDDCAATPAAPARGFVEPAPRIATRGLPPDVQAQVDAIRAEALRRAREEAARRRAVRALAYDADAAMFPAGGTPVRSSSVRSIGYHPHTDVLRVEFKTGGVYLYFAVPRHEHDRLMAAPSKGGYYAREIKGRFRSAQVPKTRPVG